jgi:hypothetical protein
MEFTFRACEIKREAAGAGLSGLNNGARVFAGIRSVLHSSRIPAF